MFASTLISIMAELKNWNLSVATEAGLAQLSTKLSPNKNQEQTIAGKDTNNIFLRAVVGLSFFKIAKSLHPG